jgi:hypothetical protein
MKYAIFWDGEPCCSCKNRRIASIFKVTRIGGRGKTLVLLFLRSVLRVLVTAIVVSSRMILVTLIMEAPRSSETSVLTRATRCHIPKYDIHSHRRENHKSYIVLTGWAL